MCTLLAETEEALSQREPKDYLIGRPVLATSENFGEASDSYLEGYIQALIDVHYYELNVIVIVKEGTVFLYHLPQNALLSKSIMVFVKNLPEVKDVVAAEGEPDQTQAAKEQKEVSDQVKGIWFPQSTVLFLPLIGDPREPLYSAIYRWNDITLGPNIIAVSFGDTFPIFRWTHIFVGSGDLQIDIQAGAWADFKMGHNHNPNNEFSELVTTDYLVGVPLTYALNAWSFRLRPYHLSSHLGDEFLVNHVGYPRKNPSMEAIDFYSSYQASSGVRVFFGPGWICHSDDTFPMKPFYFQWGTEIRLFGYRSVYHRIYGTPLFVIDIQNWQQHHWQCQTNFLLGYEWSKLQGVGRKVRCYIQYYHGYSEGQFFNRKSRFWGAGFSYGF